MTKGKQKGNRRMDTVSIRVAAETHERLKVLADFWDTTMSDAANRVIDEYVPAVKKELERRKEEKRRFEPDKQPNTSN